MSRKSKIIVAIFITMLFLGVLFSMTNTDLNDYEIWIKSDVINKSVDPLLIELGEPLLDMAITETTTTKNYVLFTVYKTRFLEFETLSIGCLNRIFLISFIDGLPSSYGKTIDDFLSANSKGINELNDGLNIISDDILSGLSKLGQVIKSTFESNETNIIESDYTSPNPDDIEDIKNRLIFNGYTESFDEALALADNIEIYLPALDKILSGEYDDTITSGYPLNVFYALSKCDSSDVEALVRKHMNLDYANLLLQGIELRKQDKRFRVSIGDYIIYEASKEDSKQIGQIGEGNVFIVLEEGINNSNEMGPRGISMYDKIQDAKTGTIGYIQRSGDLLQGGL